MTPADQKLIDDAIRSDCSAWFETHGRIFSKARILEKPRSNYLQRKINKVLAKFRELKLPIRIIALKPRQKGSTTFFAAIDYTELRRKPTAACVIGGQFSQTTGLWQMLQTYLRNDTFAWGNSGEINQREGRFIHGSTLVQETANDKLAGVSATFQLLHCTETARWNEYGVANAADVLTNLVKCVAPLPETIIILESSAENASGDFHSRWLGAIDADDFINGVVQVMPGQFVRVFAPFFEFEDSALPEALTPEQKRKVEESLDKYPEFLGEKELISKYGNIGADGVLRLGTSVKNHDAWEQLAWRRWSISEECKRDRNVFDRDYPHSWETAFQKSGDLRFNSTGLQVLEKRQATRGNGEVGRLEEGKNGRMAFIPTDELESTVILFERPHPGRRYLLTIDPMTGITQTGGKDPDLHGAFILRAGYFDHAGRWHRAATAARIVQCRWDIDVLEEQSWRLAQLYGSKTGCKIVVETNKDRGLIELFRRRGADLYQRELFNQREQKLSNALGWETTAGNRERLIENLARAIREWDKDGEGIDILCPNAITQLKHFVKKADGRSEASAGHHDDDVLAIAIGFLVIDQATTLAREAGTNLIPPDLREIAGQRGGANQFS